MRAAVDLRSLRDPPLDVNTTLSMKQLGREGPISGIDLSRGPDPQDAMLVPAEVGAFGRGAQERSRLAFEHAPIGMALLTTDWRFLRVNKALCELTGYDREELTARSLADLTHMEDLELDLRYVSEMLANTRRTYKVEKRLSYADGHAGWILLSVSLVRDDAGEPRYFISQIQDIGERKRLEAQLVFLADHDEMTGLPNRRRFREELDRGVAFAQRYGHCGALLLLDLDNFKQVNDSLGHHAGDRLVTEVARRLSKRLRATDVLARLGGDEFAVLLPQTTPADAERVAGDLVAEVAGTAVDVNGTAVRGCTSLGVALFDPGWDIDPEALLMHADLAMYLAKREGGNRFATVEGHGRPTRRLMA